MELGADVVPFKEGDYFDVAGRSWIRSVLLRLQEKYKVGNRIATLNRDLVMKATTEGVDCVVIVRGDLISPRTLRKLRERGITIVGMNNDNPFSAKHEFYKWRLLKQGIRFYDLYYAYRHSNIQQFKDAGCSNVRLLRSFFIRETSKPIQACAKSIDLVFIGHWEPDGRDAYVSSLLDLPNLTFKIYGTGWDKSLLADQITQRQGAVYPVFSEQYNEAINRAKIALVLLSGLNEDTYTRRVFEITAAKTMMLSQFTDDLTSLFQDEKEVIYFRNVKELCSKVAYFSTHERERDIVATAGYQRVMQDGHEAVDRARQMLSDIRELRNNAKS